jgi:GT2 family glycosyltransferase
VDDLSDPSVTIAVDADNPPALARPAALPRLSAGSGRWPRQTWTAKLAQSLETGAFRLRAGLAWPAWRQPPRPPAFVAALAERPPGNRAAPLVSVIMLNLNGAAMLEEAFSSLRLVNRYPAIQIILVDHASTDDSVAVAETWARVLPITIIRCAENHTFSYSCNRAAELAQGEFLLLLNNDVVLTEDVIGRMVAAAQHGASAVGLKLYQSSRARVLQHIGIRFRWNYRYLSLQPYNAVPFPGDQLIAHNPARFPAVTAAILLCRRRDYLAVGGLCEDYVYGCEDIDLCLKLRIRSGRPAICLNDVSAVHGEGRTRRRKIGRARRGAWYRHNMAVLDRRFGYLVRHEAIEQLFTDDGSYWGRRPVLRPAGTPPNSEVDRVLEELAQSRRWTIRRSLAASGYNLRGVDLLVVANPKYRLEQVRHRHPHMASVAWILGNPARWHQLEIYDLVLVGDAAGAARLVHEHGLRATALDPRDPACADRLIALIVDKLVKSHRLAIKSTGPSQDRFAGALAGWLRRAGLRVRIDPPGHWRGRDTIRDDVNVLLPGRPGCPSLPGKINLVCGEASAEPAADAQLPMGRPESVAAAILDAIAAIHPLRMRGQLDPPLVRRPGFAASSMTDRSAGSELSRTLVAGNLPPSNGSRPQGVAAR